MAAPIYAFACKSLDGKDFSLGEFAGKVLLLANTASRCGFTPQYAGLEALHREFGPQGLVVIGFPCNQFGRQEPGNADEIAAFCQSRYGVSFLLSEKIAVNGPAAHPLFRYLRAEAPGAFGSQAIKWNFTKFLVDRSGRVLGRYAPITPPQDLAEAIRQLL